MAEKNTLSILETIKKKMHKLDQKSEKIVAPTSSNEEFQYISSTSIVEAAAVLEVKVSEQKIDTTIPKFEDDLGLEDLTTEINPPISNTPPVAGAFDDFNLDDFDLDSEAKNLATDSQTGEAKNKEVYDFSEDEIENFEDEIDIAEDEVAEKKVKEDPQDAIVEDVDWLGNKIIDDEVEELPVVAKSKVDDLDLTFGEENHKEVEETKHDELDLENLEEAHEEENSEEDALDLEVDEEKDNDLEHLEEENDEEDTLDLESQEEDKIEDDDLDLEEENHEEELEENHEENHEEELEEELEEDHEEELEEDVLDPENHEEEPATRELAEDDDLNFDDLENLSPKKLEPQIHKDLNDDLDLELEMADKKPEALKTQTLPVMASKNPSTNGIDLLDLEMKEKPILKTPSNDEIDLEFEKEIMGLKPASLPEKQIEDFISNPAPLQPQVAQQNYDFQSQVFVMNSTKGTDNMSNGIYDSTLRQVGDSVRKLVDAKNIVSGISTFSQGPAFVELATHLMEPKLEKWLNEHLPDLVEQIVREEIKKIIPRD